MWYRSEKGQVIQILNRRPRNLSQGGLIRDHPKILHKDADTISSLLEYGSLVIPVPVMESGIMQKYKGPLTGPKITDKSKLAPVIVMPNEYVVNKKHAPAVEKYLKKNGITLPLPK